MEIIKPAVLDILDTKGAPALSATSDVPVIETKPDAQNEGKPPDVSAVPPEAPPAEGEAEQPGESATPATEEPTGQPTEDKVVPRGVGKRLAELTKRIDEERQEKLRLMALLEERRKVEEAPKVVEDPEPERPFKHEFPDPDAYETALLSYTERKASWSARQEVKAAREADRAEAERKAIEEGQTKVIDAYNARQEKTKQKYADYEQVANSPDVFVPPAVVHAILNSENGPELKYYFGSHPEEAKRLLAIESPVVQLMELGKLEASLMAPPPQPKQVSAAPKPLTPLKAGTESAPVDVDNMSMEDYAKMRRSQENWADPARPRGGNTRH